MGHIIGLISLKSLYLFIEAVLTIILYNDLMLFEIRFYFSQIYQNKEVTLVRPIKINGNEDLEALNFFAKHSNNAGLNKYGTF